MKNEIIIFLLALIILTESSAFPLSSLAFAEHLDKRYLTDKITQNEVRRAFGVFGSANRTIRLPSDRSDDYSRTGGGTGGSYNTEFKSIMKHDIPITLSYLRRKNWNSIYSSLDNILSSFQSNIQKNNGLKIVIRGGLLPYGSLEEASNGSFDAELLHLGEIFSKYPKDVLSRVIFNPNWEFNGNWYPWSIVDKSKRNRFDSSFAYFYKKYWQRIHNIVNRPLKDSEKSIKWSFEFAGTKMARQKLMDIEKITKAIELTYPGDDYVDIFGCSLYGTEDVFKNPKSLLATLNYLSSFAEMHHLKTGISETSLWFYNKKYSQDGFNGDWPDFFSTIHQWMSRETDLKRLSHVILFDVDTANGSMHDVLFFDTREFLLKKNLTRPFIRPEKGNEWSNSPRSRKMIIDLFSGPLAIITDN